LTETADFEDLLEITSDPARIKEGIEVAGGTYFMSHGPDDTAKAPEPTEKPPTAPTKSE
jgi:hypothetical protein